MYPDRKAPRVTLSRSAPLVGVGPTTQRFFLEGEQNEATNWKFAHLPPDDVVVDDELGFASFDKIPRRRGTVMAAAAIAACLIGGAVWTLTSEPMRKSEWSVMSLGHGFVTALRSKVVAPRTAPPEPLAASPAPAPPSVGQAALVAQVSSQPAASISGAATKTASGWFPAQPPHSETQPSGARSSEAQPLEDSAESGQDAPDNQPPVQPKDRPPRSPRRGATVSSAPALAPGAPANNHGDRGPSPLRGYVWSPEAKALVPVPSELPGTMDPEPATDDRTRVSPVVNDPPPGERSTVDDRPLPLTLPAE